MKKLSEAHFLVLSTITKRLPMIYTTDVESPSVQLVFAQPTMFLEEKATSLRRAVAGLLFFSIMSPPHIGSMLGFFVALTILFSSTPALAGRASRARCLCIIVALLAGSVSLASLHSLGVAGPQRFSNEMEARCIKMPPSTFNSISYMQMGTVLLQGYEPPEQPRTGMEPSISREQEHVCDMMQHFIVDMGSFFLVATALAEWFLCVAALVVAKRAGEVARACACSAASTTVTPLPVKE